MFFFLLWKKYILKDINLKKESYKLIKFYTPNIIKL